MCNECESLKERVLDLERKEEDLREGLRTTKEKVDKLVAVAQRSVWLHSIDHCEDRVKEGDDVFTCRRRDGLVPLCCFESCPMVHV